MADSQVTHCSPCGWIKFCGRMPDNSYRLSLWLPRDMAADMFRQRCTYTPCAYGSALFTFTNDDASSVKVTDYETGRAVLSRIGEGSRGRAQFVPTAGVPRLLAVELTTLVEPGRRAVTSIVEGFPNY